MPPEKLQSRYQKFVSSGDDASGPSYFDVRELSCQLEREFGVRVSFLVDPENVTERWKFNRMWVRARAYKAGGKGHGDLYAGQPLGGNSGSKTMPGAMIAALLELWDKCLERDTAVPKTDA